MRPSWKQHTTARTMDDNEDNKNDDDGDNQGGPPQQNFTPIQTRLFRRTIPCWSLCPSMDLVALGMGDVGSDSHRAGGSPSKRNKAAGSSSDAIGVADTLSVHRIVSWQRLLNLSYDELTSSRVGSEDEGGVDDECMEDIEWDLAEDGGGPLFPNAEADASEEPNKQYLKRILGATSICWSPDGRCVAIGLLDGGVLIHNVEPDANVSGANAASGEPDHRPLHIIRPPPSRPSQPETDDAKESEQSSSSWAADEQKQAVLFSPRVTRSMAAKYNKGGDSNKIVGSNDDFAVDAQPSAVVGLSWNRVSPRHSSWNLSNSEVERNEAWKQQSQLIDRGSKILPPGSFAKCDSSDTSLSQLNLLCVATQKELHWYLQGRYRIASIPFKSDYGRRANNASDVGVQSVFSPDLSTALVVSGQSSSVATAMIISSSLLIANRYDLQIISASYRSIFSRLRDARQGIQSALKSWDSALRPLNVKFNGLLTLLRGYNIATGGGESHDLIRSELLRFILSGRSTVVGDASNALDQFFTRPHFHDQLFQREARGIEASAASVEGILRSNVLSHLRAVVYETEELYGLARAQGNSEKVSFIDPEMTLRLYTASRLLFLTFQRCIAQIVEARSRLHDFLAWMRGSASQIRARGTAMDSVQRKNASDRRVPNGVILRVTDFLSMPIKSTLTDGTNKLKHRNLTECIIGLPISDFFAGEIEQEQGKFCAALNSPFYMMLESNYFSIQAADNATISNMNNANTLKSALKMTFQISSALFEQPRHVLSQSFHRLGKSSPR
jgi:hypothetical protein